MRLYSILLIVTILIPLSLSFDKKLQFFKQWKFVLPSIIIIASFFIAADIYMTRNGVWGFNPRYHSRILLFDMPVEEWLFFILVPYSSIFLHECIVLYFPKLRLPAGIGRFLTFLLIIGSVYLIIDNPGKDYTVYSSVLVIISLILSFFDKSLSVNTFYVSFLIILIPFLILNSILTGSFIDQEVVWYNNNENLDIRFFTIPVEDFGYGFSLILLNILLVNLLKKISKTGQVKHLPYV